MAENKFYTDKLQKLVGKQITGVASDGGEFFGLVVDKKTVLWILRDDEGNGPGSFEIAKL